MAKAELIKSMEARKLNNRTRFTLAEAPVTLNYGAILDEIVENGEMVEFMYLGQAYSCKSEVMRAASVPLGEGVPTVEAQAARSNTAAEPPSFVWESLRSGSIPTQRAKLPGGWLIAVGDSGRRSIAFYPDPDHAWDGKTL